MWYGGGLGEGEPEGEGEGEGDGLGDGEGLGEGEADGQGSNVQVAGSQGLPHAFVSPGTHSAPQPLLHEACASQTYPSFTTLHSLVDGQEPPGHETVSFCPS